MWFGANVESAVDEIFTRRDGPYNQRAIRVLGQDSNMLLLCDELALIRVDDDDDPYVDIVYITGNVIENNIKIKADIRRYHLNGEVYVVEKCERGDLIWRKADIGDTKIINKK